LIGELTRIALFPAQYPQILLKLDRYLSHILYSLLSAIPFSRFPLFTPFPILFNPQHRFLFGYSRTELEIDMNHRLM
jgi:hypothetical protein